MKKSKKNKKSKKSKIDKEALDGLSLLHIYCYLNDTKTVKRLIRKCHDPNVQDKNGTTPLHWCAYRGNLKLVQMLTEAGGSLNAADKQFVKPIHLAVIGGNLNVIKYINSKVKISDTGLHIESPYHLAVLYGHYEITKYFLDSPAQYINEHDYATITALNLAAARNHYSLVKLLINKHGSSEITDAYDRIPLHWAAYNGNFQLVKLLLDSESTDFMRNSIDKEGNTPLFLATMNGHFDLVKYMLKHGCFLSLNTGIRRYYFELSNAIGPDEFVDMNFGDMLGVVSFFHWALAMCTQPIDLRFLFIFLQVQFPAVRSRRDVWGNSPLHTACAYGNEAAVRYMLEFDFDLNAVNDAEETAMHWAAAHGYLDIVKLLVSHRAGIQGSLLWAAANGHYDIVKYLVEEGADYVENDRDPDYARNSIQWAATCGQGHVLDYFFDVFPQSFNTLDLLHWCAYNEMGPQIQRILSRDVNVNVVDSVYQRSALHYAAQNSDLEIVKMLVSAGVNVNTIDIDGDSAVHLAVDNKHVDVVQYLIEVGADLNIPGNLNTDCMEIVGRAVYTNNLEMVKLLVKAGAHVNEADRTVNLPLNIAVRCKYKEIEEYLLANSANKTGYFHTKVREGDIQDLIELLDSGVDVNEVDEEHQNALFQAVEVNDVEKIKTLISRGANIHHKNIRGETPLHHAIEWIAEESSLFLIKNGADVNAMSNDRVTPIMSAVWVRSDYLFNLLLDHKADLEIQDKEGETVIFLAVQSDSLGYVEKLIKQNVNIHTQSSDGKTLLHRAAEGYTSEFIDLFLKTDLDMDLASNDQSTPLSVSVKYNRSTTFKKLIANGADVNAAPNILNDCVSDDRLQLLELLINCGLKVDKINSPVDGHNQVLPKIFEVMEYAGTHPLSLKQICRIQLRQHFKKKYSLLCRYNRLPIEVQYYLMYAHEFKKLFINGELW